MVLTPASAICNVDAMNNFTLQADVKKLQKAFSNMLPAAGRSTLPALMHVSIKSQDGCLRLGANDLDTCIEERFAVRGDNGGCAIPHAAFKKALSNLDAGVVTLRADGQRLAFIQGELRQTIFSIPLTEVPAQRPCEGQGTVVTVAEVRKLLAPVLHAVSADYAKLNQTGVYFHLVGGKLRAAACDGHRLALTEALKAECVAEHFVESTLLPTGLRVLLKALNGFDDVQTVGIYTTKRHTTFVVNTTERVSIVDVAAVDLDGRSPLDYSCILPTSPVHQGYAFVGLKDLQKALKPVAVREIGPERLVSIGAGVDFQRVVLTARTEEGVEIVSKAKAEVDGDELAAGVNPFYVADVLGAVDADLRIAWNSNYEPLYITPRWQDEQVSFVALIMPGKV